MAILQVIIHSGLNARREIIINIMRFLFMKSGVQSPDVDP